ncbi:MAG: hypothetical protein R6X20_07765 [Phycisphaerae bacterium]
MPAREPPGAPSRGEPFRPERAEESPDCNAHPADEYWEQFEDADYEDRLRLFSKTLQSGAFEADAGNEYAYDMLASLSVQTAKHGQHERFDRMVRDLRDRAPAAYESDAPYYGWLLLEHALARKDHPRVMELARELGETTEQSAEVVFQIRDLLCFYGEMPALLEMVRRAWRWIEDGHHDLMPHAVEEFKQTATDLELLDWADRHPDGGDQSGLMDRLRGYAEILPERVRLHLEALSGHLDRVWTLDDFRGLSEDVKEGEDDPAMNFRLFAFEFMGHARRRHGVAYPTLWCGYQQLLHYVHEQDEKRPARSARCAGKKGRKGRRRGRDRQGRRPALVPDRASLDSFVADLLQPFMTQIHAATSVMLIVPYWLAFLEDRDLLAPGRGNEIQEELRPLLTELEDCLTRMISEPGLMERVRESWERSP